MKCTNKILILLTGLLAVTSFTSCINADVKEEKDLSTMVGRISYAARKYNKRITRNKILSGSKLTENSPYTIENFIKEVGSGKLHGPKWVDKVLHDYPDLDNEVYKTLREFVASLRV